MTGAISAKEHRLSIKTVWKKRNVHSALLGSIFIHTVMSPESSIRLAPFQPKNIVFPSKLFAKKRNVHSALLGSIFILGLNCIPQLKQLFVTLAEWLSN